MHIMFCHLLDAQHSHKVKLPFHPCWCACQSATMAPVVPGVLHSDSRQEDLALLLLLMWLIPPLTRFVYLWTLP